MNDFRFTGPKSPSVNTGASTKGGPNILTKLGRSLSGGRGGTNRHDVDIAMLNVINEREKRSQETSMAEVNHSHVKELAGLGTPTEISTPYHTVKFATTQPESHSTPPAERSEIPFGLITQHINHLLASKNITGARAMEKHQAKIKDHLSMLHKKYGRGPVTEAIKSHPLYQDVSAMKSEKAKAARASKKAPK